MRPQTWKTEVNANSPLVQADLLLSALSLLGLPVALEAPAWKTTMQWGSFLHIAMLRLITACHVFYMRMLWCVACAGFLLTGGPGSPSPWGPRGPGCPRKPTSPCGVCVCVRENTNSVRHRGLIMCIYHNNRVVDFTLGPGRPIPGSPWNPGGPGSPRSPYKTHTDTKQLQTYSSFVNSSYAPFKRAHKPDEVTSLSFFHTHIKTKITGPSCNIQLFLLLFF